MHCLPFQLTNSTASHSGRRDWIGYSAWRSTRRLKLPCSDSRSRGSAVITGVSYPAVVNAYSFGPTLPSGAISRQPGVVVGDRGLTGARRTGR